jgi:ketosteroid isomerase-like protein
MRIRSRPSHTTVTESENVRLVRRAFADWNRGDRTPPVADLDPGVELHTPLASVKGRPYRGHEGVREWMVDIQEHFERFDLRADEFRELDGDVVLVLGGVNLRGRMSGAEMYQEVGFVFRLRDHKLVRMELFYDQGEALRSVGLGASNPAISSPR